MADLLLGLEQFPVVFAGCDDQLSTVVLRHTEPLRRERNNITIQYKYNKIQYKHEHSLK